MKRLKKIAIIACIVILIILYEIFQYNATKSNSEGLSVTGNFMKEVPLSIPYVIISVSLLYFLGKLSFFKGIQIQQKEFFVKQKKSTTKEIIATIVFGLIVIALMIGFIAIIFNGTA